MYIRIYLRCTDPRKLNFFPSSSFFQQPSVGFGFSTRSAHRHLCPVFHTQYSNILQDFIRPSVPWMFSRDLYPIGLHSKTLFTNLYSSSVYKWMHHFNVGALMNLTGLDPSITYSMVQSPSWEASWFAASQEIPRILWNPKVHYRIHKLPPPIPILG